MNYAFILHFIVYCCTPKVLYNHGGGVSPQLPPVCSIHLDEEPDGLAEEAPPQSLSLCHHVTEALARWQ